MKYEFLTPPVPADSSVWPRVQADIAAWRPRASRELPTSPLALNVIDAAGNLALTQSIFDNYREGQAELVSQLHLQQSPFARTARQDQGAAASQPGRYRHGHHRPDALSAGLADDIWIDLIGCQQRPSRSQAIYLDPA